MEIQVKVQIKRIPCEYKNNKIVLGVILTLHSYFVCLSLRIAWQLLKCILKNTLIGIVQH